MLYPYNPTTMRLGSDLGLNDDLERELVQQAIEEQFRPRPFLALAQWLLRLLQSPRTPANAGKTAHA